MGNPPQSFLERHLSPARLNLYFAACNNDFARAAELYAWNHTISAALWESLSHLEVVLRNAIDAALSRRHIRLGRPSHWIFDNAYEFGRDPSGAQQHAYPYLDVITARRRVHKNNKPITPDQIISEVSFGFWHQFVSKGQQRLWPDLVSAAFPHAPDRAQTTVNAPVAALRNLRNRISHHHRIWNHDLEARYVDILAVASFIDPDLGIWIDAQSRVPKLLTIRPQASSSGSRAR